MASASPLSPTAHQTFKFPAFQPDHLPVHEEEPYGLGSSRSPSPNIPTRSNGNITTDRWKAAHRESSPYHAANSHNAAAGRHGRQKSLSEAWQAIRAPGRRASVSQNAHEIAEALKAPISPKLIFLCAIWYMTSILSNTSSKAILTTLKKPVTLTVIQFAFVSSWCLFLAALARQYPALKTAIPVLKFPIRPPTKELIMTTLPLTLFQIGGHILSSDAMSLIPVSLVHTIKGLSPLLTVIAYRIFLDVRYSTPTYLSLIPLTLGVALACSADFNANFLGLVYAFGSAILFVTQNIVSKKLFDEAAIAESDRVPTKFSKPDKLNLLCYSSGLAFLFTLPIWIWSEGLGLLSDFLQDASVELTNRPGSLDHGQLVLEFFFNGTFHFGQNIVAFILLSMVSPVTYSVASLIKRVFVIVFAIIWFGKSMTHTQGFGFLLTFFGLYLYDRMSDADKADRKARLRASRQNGTLLPITTSKLPTAPYSASPAVMSATNGPNGAPEFTPRDEKRSDDVRSGRPHGMSNNQWLPPGTKQEQTWRNGSPYNNSAGT